MTDNLLIFDDFPYDIEIVDRGHEPCRQKLLRNKQLKDKFEKNNTSYFKYADLKTSGLIPFN